jgi:hypothetical protein
MEILISIGGLCCVSYIKPIGIVAGVRRQRLGLSIGLT